MKPWSLTARSFWHLSCYPTPSQVVTLINKVNRLKFYKNIFSILFCFQRPGQLCSAVKKRNKRTRDDDEEAFAAEVLLTISACLTQFSYRHIVLRILFSGISLPSFFLQRKIVESKKCYILGHHSVVICRPIWNDGGYFFYKVFFLSFFLLLLLKLLVIAF